MSRPRLLAPAGFLGRALSGALRGCLCVLRHTSGIVHLALAVNYHAFVAPLRGRTRLREQLFLVMRNVGVMSFPIIALISFLLGAILVLQAGEPLKQFGQIQEAPGAVAWSLTREIGPLLTSIIMTARVGASFTAVIASMKVDEEILALETMAINPIGYLVAPRYISMLVMLPCLTVFSYLIGMFGGAVIANGIYGLSYQLYIEKTVFYLSMTDVVSGLVKATIFGVIVTMVCCYFGLTAEGGPVGVGRNIMVAVVTTLVLIIVADALATAFINNYVL